VDFLSHALAQGLVDQLVARDAVAVYLVQPTWITVANARVKGLWKDMPLFVNDVAAMSWQ
jgi:peptide/nickel transport system substrate-binding protein